MLLKMWQGLWRFYRGMKTNRSHWRGGFVKYPRVLKGMSPQPPDSTWECTWVGKVLLATHSSWSAWARRESWLYWWSIQSVPERDLPGSGQDSGDLEQVWVPLSFMWICFEKFIWREGHKHFVQNILNLCNVKYLFYDRIMQSFGLLSNWYSKGMGSGGIAPTQSW